MRMADCDLSPDGLGFCGDAPRVEASEADFKSARLREQYRSLARLGPYVHGVVILATLTLSSATAQISLVDGIVLPAALLVISLFRLVLRRVSECGMMA